MTREQIAKLSPAELVRLAREENQESVEQNYLKAISVMLAIGCFKSAFNLLDEYRLLFGDPSAPIPVGILSYSGVAENEVIIADENNEVLCKIVGGNE